MGLCVIVGCDYHPCRAQVKRSFFRIPAVILHHDEETKLISTERRKRWLIAIRRADRELNEYDRVCSRHFISGKSTIINMFYFHIYGTSM